MVRIAATLVRVERAAVWIGNAVLMALMLLVTVDVFLRYFVNRPLVWTHDVVTLYLMPAIFFLMLSDSFRDGAQVRVDILRNHFPPRFRVLADTVGYLATLVVFALIGVGASRQLVEAWEAREVVAGSIPWPVWPSFLLAAVGSIMLVLRLAAACVSGHGPDEGAAGEKNTSVAGRLAE